MAFAATLAEILKTTERNALVRAAKMKLLPVCNRFGGGGRYSFNGSHSVCYGCNGGGQRPAIKASEQAAVIRAASDAADGGQLDQYLEYLAALGRSKNATEKVMAAWRATGISDAYRWQDAAAGVSRDRAIADINARMAVAYDATSKAATAAMFPKDKGRTQHLVLELDRTMAASLAEIADADAAFKAYLASESSGAA